MTLNQIAEDIAFKLGDQFNTTLKESIKHTIIIYRAKYIKDELSKGNAMANDFFQSFILEMQQVNKLEDVGASISCITSGTNCAVVINNKRFQILKSKQQIPETIRLKGYGKTPYRFIGSADRLTRFLYSDPTELEFKLAVPYQNPRIPYFFIVNNYLYLLNTLKVCNVLIEGIFANPREVSNACGEGKFADDKTFPIPADMLLSITTNIVSNNYPIRGEDGETVNIQKDDNIKNNGTAVQS